MLIVGRDTLSMSRLERDPNILLRLLTTVAIVSIVLIVSLTTYGIYSSSVDDYLRIAEGDAIRVGTIMVDQQYHYLYSDGEESLSVSAEDIDLLDRYFRDFLHPFAIVKIKVFALDGTIIYSTDKNIIGMKVVDNPRLERALTGEVDSHQETKEKVIDLAEEQLMDVDVVETYLPVFNKGGAIAGCFELYVDITRYRDEISRRVSISISILFVILLGVFALSFLVVNMGARQLKKLLSRLQQQAATDPLTGIFNRGAVLNRATEEHSRMIRNKEKKTVVGFGLIMVDLDHFKKVNDTYGHLAGDEVLREMSRRVQSCLRKYDVFGRYGGEEFLVILPDTDDKVSRTVAERIRCELFKSPFVAGEHEMSITASFGVACCQDPAEGVNSALQRTDDALYQAKAEGRNRVIVARSEPVDQDGH
jgi:diguanylate cyclase (GGDEF)-like protein